MALNTSRFAGASALVAALSMAASPAFAAQLSSTANSSVANSPIEMNAAPQADTASNHRWDRYGGYRGRGYRRHRGVSGGDILAGVLILGGIAAIASAANNSNRNTRTRDRDYRDDRYREPYRQDRYEYRGQQRGSGSETSNSQSSGVNNAVNMCLEQVERGDDRVASVDNAARGADGWRISGQLNAGGGFSCWIDNDGRIRDVDLGNTLSAYDAPVQDRQWNDQAYAAARAQIVAPSPNGADAIDADLEGRLGG